MTGVQRTLDPDELDLLVFGQCHARSAPWFMRQVGQTHSIPVVEFPQYRTLAGDRDAYHEYCDLSWPWYGRSNTEALRKQHDDWIHAQAAAGQIDPTPVPVIERGELLVDCAPSRLVIVDGNHRAALAAYLGRPLVVDVGPPNPWIERTVKNTGEFYGTKHRGIPYQTVTIDGYVVVVGRRTDLVERHESMNPDDIVGKHVVDVGCNIGAASFLAAEAGAASVFGFDVSEKIITAALRLGAFSGLPVEFATRNAAVPFTRDLLDRPCDTMFLFSVAAHIGDVTHLVRLIDAYRPSVVYVEGHDGWTWETHHRPLHPLVESVEEIVGPERTMWRCVLRK